MTLTEIDDTGSVDLVLIWAVTNLGMSRLYSLTFRNIPPTVHPTSSGPSRPCAARDIGCGASL